MHSIFYCLFTIHFPPLSGPIREMIPDILRVLILSSTLRLDIPIICAMSSIVTFEFSSIILIIFSTFFSTFFSTIFSEPTTFHCPPLSGPMRWITPSDLSIFIFSSTHRLEIQSFVQYHPMLRKDFVSSFQLLSPHFSPHWVRFSPHFSPH